MKNKNKFQDKKLWVDLACYIISKSSTERSFKSRALKMKMKFNRFYEEGKIPVKGSKCRKSSKVPDYLKNKLGKKAKDNFLAHVNECNICFLEINNLLLKRRKDDG